MKLTSVIFANLCIASFGIGAAPLAYAVDAGKFSEIHATCHYEISKGCAQYDNRSLTVDGVLYYPNENVLNIAQLYPKDAVVPAHDTAQGWSTELQRRAIIIDISELSNAARAELYAQHLKPVSVSGTVRNDCVLSMQISASNLDDGVYTPPAPLDTSCPSPNQITLYLTDVTLTESL